MRLEFGLGLTATRSLQSRPTDLGSRHALTRWRLTVLGFIVGSLQSRPTDFGSRHPCTRWSMKTSGPTVGGLQSRPIDFGSRHPDTPLGLRIWGLAIYDLQSHPTNWISQPTLSCSRGPFDARLGESTSIATCGLCVRVRVYVYRSGCSSWCRLRWWWWW